MRSLPTFAILLLLLPGCGRKERTELDNLEQLYATTTAKFLSFYEAQHADTRATNAAQVFALMDLNNAGATHPYVLQEKFKVFGKKSGFKNSIYEKYLSVSLVTTNHSIAGEIVFLSAEPFLDINQDAVRMAIWKAGKQDYRVSRLEERRIQAICKEAALSLPKPPSMPQPEAPPNLQRLSYPIQTRIRLFFEDLAYHYGPGRFFWLPMMLICGFIILVAAVFLFVWFGRRGRH